MLRYNINIVGFLVTLSVCIWIKIGVINYFLISWAYYEPNPSIKFSILI